MFRNETRKNTLSQHIADVRGGGGEGVQGRAAECLPLHRLVVVGTLARIFDLKPYFPSQTETQDAQQLPPWAGKADSRSFSQLNCRTLCSKSNCIDQGFLGAFLPVYIITFFLELLGVF